MRSRLKMMMGLCFMVMVLWSCEEGLEEDEFISKEVSMSFAGGDGSKEDPYQIANAGQLRLVEKHMNKHFILMKDIDLRGVEDFKPIAIGSGVTRFFTRFEGVFDGNGKKIKNLRIRRPGRYATDAVGFFGVIGVNGVVKKVGLEDVDIVGKNFLGGIVGYNFGRIESSYVTGKVGGELVVGGVVGFNKGKVEGSYMRGDVLGKDIQVGGLVGHNIGRIGNSYAAGTVTGNNVVGGLVGINNQGRVGNSYATVTVTGNNGVGGLVGKNLGVIRNSYTAGTVTGSLLKGGFLGNISQPGMQDGKVTGKNYWKEGSALQGVGEGRGANVERKTDVELKGLDATETGWDATIWNFEAGKYPKLAWQD